jgi:hypothetical protein
MLTVGTVPLDFQPPMLLPEPTAPRDLFRRRVNVDS